MEEQHAHTPSQSPRGVNASHLHVVNLDAMSIAIIVEDISKNVSRLNGLLD